jgi:hypothetical protein
MNLINLLIQIIISESTEMMSGVEDELPDLLWLNDAERTAIEPYRQRTNYNGFGLKCRIEIDRGVIR